MLDIAHPNAMCVTQGFAIDQHIAESSERLGLFSIVFHCSTIIGRVYQTNHSLQIDYER